MQNSELILLILQTANIIFKWVISYKLIMGSQILILIKQQQALVNLNTANNL